MTHLTLEGLRNAVANDAAIRRTKPTTENPQASCGPGAELVHWEVLPNRPKREKSR